MNNKKIGRQGIALLLAVGLISAACDVGGSAAPTAVKAPATSAPAGSSSTTLPAAGQSGKPAGKLDCGALQAALADLVGRQTSLMALTLGNGVNSLDSMFYVDTGKVRADLDVLSELPDPTDPIEISMAGKPSEAIPQYRKLLDQVDAASTPGAKPMPTVVLGSDQQALNAGMSFAKLSLPLSFAMDKACKDQPTTVAGAPAPTPQAVAPLKASYQVGQTGSVGNLRVTLDKVVAAPGAGGVQPDPGTQFVMVHLTVENKGATPFGINASANTQLQDASGKPYYWNPNTIMLDPATTNLDGALAPGEKRSGVFGYQVPRAPGDLVWAFQDAKPNVAAFAIKAGDIQSTGAPVTEATAQAQRDSAAATQTAFLGMASDLANAEATAQAAGTGTPVPEDTAVPTDTATSP